MISGNRAIPGYVASFGQREGIGQDSTPTAVNALDIRERSPMHVSDAVAAGHVIEPPGWREADALEEVEGEHWPSPG
jgi:hypothetical protein